MHFTSYSLYLTSSCPCYHLVWILHPLGKRCIIINQYMPECKSSTCKDIIHALQCKSGTHQAATRRKKWRKHPAGNPVDQQRNRFHFDKGIFVWDWYKKPFEVGHEKAAFNDNLIDFPWPSLRKSSLSEKFREILISLCLPVNSREGWP